MQKSTLVLSPEKMEIFEIEKKEVLSDISISLWRSQL